jgi:membrane protease YdiL (CAAX protease family)
MYKVKEMNEKKKCPNCGLLIDSDMEKCPYCGAMIKEEEEKINKSSKMNVSNTSKTQEKQKFDKSILKFTERNDVSTIKEVSLFLVNFLGLSLITFLIAIIANQFNPSFISTSVGNSMLFFASYFILFGIFLLILNKDLIKVSKKFLEGRTYLYGVSYGFLVILLTALYNVAIHYFVPGLSQNNNESSLESIITNYPFLSIIVMGLIGPFCEELGYRYGLFSLVRKWNRVAAYIITIIIFTIIHFDFTSSNMLNELCNAPSYAIAGLLFSYVYDKEGIETSSIAHMTNNLFSVIMAILSEVLLHG